MSTLFLDTSALAKRYLTETGSAWLRHIAHPTGDHIMLITELTTVEMYSLLARHAREGSLAMDNATMLGHAFLLHTEHEYLVLPLDGQVLAQARILVGQYPLRTLDALQLACAQRAGTILGEAISFISSDRTLLAAASAEGLATDDPLAHP